MTATFPNEKFYNIEAYERRMDAMRAGEFVPPTDDSYDADADMRAHQNNLKRPAVESESFYDKDQLQELRRVQRERVEVRWIARVPVTGWRIDDLTPRPAR
jgi:hypothetical protein